MLAPRQSGKQGRRSGPRPPGRPMFLLVTLVGLAGCGWRGDPTSQIVATYSGGEITRAEISDFVHERLPRCLEDAICPEHGWDHSRCSKDEQCEGYCQFHEGIESPQLYELVIRDLVASEIAKRVATTRKIDKRHDIKHALEHLDEALTLEDLGARVSEQARVSESDIARYYEEHRSEFEGESLSEVKDRIKRRLAPTAERVYLDNYIAELKRNAVRTKNYELLRDPDSADPGRTLFTVHGESYSLGDFLRELKELPQTVQDRYRTFEARRELLDKLAERMLIVEGARDESRNPELQQEFERERTLLLAQVLHEEEVEDKLKVSDQEVEEFYAQNRLHYREPAKVKLGYIRLAGGPTEKDREEARNKAKELCKRLNPGWFREGADFAQVAQKESADANFLKDGYLLEEWIPLDFSLLNPLPPVLVAELQPLQAGDMTEPMPFLGDYFIFQVVDRQAPRLPPLEEVKAHVRRDVERMKHQQLTAQLQERLMKQANLKINQAALKDMLKKHRAQQKPAGPERPSLPFLTTPNREGE